MRSFFKIFFAAFLALVVFTLVAFFVMVGIVGSKLAKDKPDIPDKSILVLDLGKHFSEKMQPDPLAALSGDGDLPGLYDVVRIIRHASNDENVSGIYIIANDNANSFASSNELRNALLEFRSSKKFVIAHGDMMSQSAYFVANAAERVYVNPVGSFQWNGFNMAISFLKGTLDKLAIKPQIFYAGKFKSATEPLRTDKMTPENKLQTNEWLGDLYQYFLLRSAEARKKDTASLHQLANTAAIQTPQDAVRYGLLDGVKYDDEVKDEFKKRLGLGKYDKMSFVPISKYADAADYKESGSNRIAVIYAEGNIVDGAGSTSSIGGDAFRNIIRKARLDKSIKAIVLRVNSGGGSALASENIWRELEMAKADKPVVVSFGDVAASGGYYIACGADSIFASPNTITGSIGVFGVVPNMEGFFREKLGITFDGVKTSPYADAGAVYRPLNEAEMQFFQNSVDRIYLQFKQRVAKGRKKDIHYIDSIAQGRVWSGEDAVRLGLVDRIGSLHDAIRCAARLAKTDSYRVREYPEASSWLDELLNRRSTDPAALMKAQLGAENYRVYQQLMSIREMSGSVQARLPFEFFIH
jgi:protease-4